MAGKKGMHDYKRLFNPAYLDSLRAKIDATKLLNRLQDHAIGTVEMSQTQITAALGLLRKVLPELAATDAVVTHKGTIVDVLREISPQNQAHKPEPKKDEERPALH